MCLLLCGVGRARTSASLDSSGTVNQAIRYRFEFVGVEPLPLPDHVYRERPVTAGTVELYQAQRFLVESVDETTDPPVAVLRKVRS